MADASVTITPGSGASVDTRTQGNGDHRQIIGIGDPTSADILPVDATTGIPVHITASAVETSLEIKNLGGNTIYSNITGDFTAVFTNGTKELVLSAFSNPALESALSVGSLANGNVKKISSTGVVSSIPLTSITLATTTYTLADAPSNFVTGDVAVVTLIGPDKAYNTAENLFEFKNLTIIEGEDVIAHTLRTTNYPVAGIDYGTTAGDNTYSSRVTKKSEKAAAGNVYAVRVFNFGSSLAYFQLHNKASAPIATDVPMTGCSFPVAAGTATSPGILALSTADFAPSNYHSTGIAWAISSTLSTFTDGFSGSPTDFVVNIRRV